MLLKHGISGLHMRQLIPIEGEYKERGWDVPKRDEVISDFISAIKKANLTGIGIAIEMAYWRNLKKQYPDVKFGSAQEFCFQRILRKIVDRLHAAQLEGEVAILFDRDPEFAANRMNIFSSVLQHDRLANELLASITFAKPHRYPGLQCADLLAWETRKELVQRDAGYKSTKRWEQLLAQMPE